MFSTPGIAALIILIYMKPQEFVPGMQGLPLLYVMLGAATLGLLLDLRLGHARFNIPPQSPYVIAFLGWCFVTRLVKAGPTGLPTIILELAIVFVLFFLLACGIQSFRAQEFVLGSLLAVTLFVAGVCFDQGLSPLGCAVYEGNTAETLRGDGRPCVKADDCYTGDAEPGASYACERTGMFGTVSVGGGRVRYRGVLKDPNEIALTCGAAIPILIARAQRKRSVFRTLLLGAGILLIAFVVVMTQSRGGVLVFLAILGAYFIRTFGIKGLGVAAMLGAPLIMLGGRSGTEAESSAGERSEVLLDGLHMFGDSPVFGVGYGQFTEHSYLTAHNSYMLALSENGFPGLFLFLCVLAVSVKICASCLVRYKRDDDAKIARTWAMAILASLIGASVGAFFLSFTYHHVLWIYFAMAGALYTTVRRHDPTFKISLGLKEHGAVAIATAGFVVLVRVGLKLKGI